MERMTKRSGRMLGPLLGPYVRRENTEHSNNNEVRALEMLFGLSRQSLNGDILGRE